MRIDKLLASLQVAGLATAATPDFGVYQRSFNDTGLGNNTSVQAVSSVSASSNATSALSSSSTSIATASANGTTSSLDASSTTPEARNGTTTTSVTEQVTVTAFDNSKSSISRTAAANAIFISTSADNTTQQTQPTESISSSAFNSTSAPVSISGTSTTKQSNETVTTVATEEVTRTALINITITVTTVVDGTLTTYITTDQVMSTSSVAVNAAAATTTSIATLTSASGNSRGCSSYYIAQEGDSCASIASMFSMTIAGLKQSNPSIESCDDLSTGSTYCVSARNQSTSVSAANATLSNAAVSASASASVASTQYALIYGSTVVVAEITSTVMGSAASTGAARVNASINATSSVENATEVSSIKSSVAGSNATAGPVNASKSSLTSASGLALTTTVLTSSSSASSVQVLSATTETLTSVVTKTKYYTVDVTSTQYVTSTEYEVTVTEYVTKYVTVSIKALMALGRPTTLARDDSCGTAKTTVVVLPASMSPTIVATPGVSMSPATSSASGSARSQQSTTSTTSGAASSATATVKFCPDLNGTVWTDAQGQEHAIYCNMGFNGTVISIASSLRVLYHSDSVANGNATSDNTTLSANASDVAARRLRKRAAPTSLGQCITQCSAITNCVGTAFDGSTCTYYSDLTTSYAANGVRFAKLVVSSASTSSLVATSASVAGTSTSVICNPSVTAVIKSNRPKPRVFCTNWNASKPHTTSPITGLTIKQINNGCGCILAQPGSSTTGATVMTSSTSTLKSSSSLSSTTKSSFTTSKAATRTFSTSVIKSSACSSVTAPAPTQTGIISGCTQYYVAQSGDYCYLIADKYDLDVNTFMAWNPAVNAPSCSNVQVGDAYCVATSSCGSSGTSTTLTSSAGTTTAKTSSKTTSTSTTSTSSAVPYKMYRGNGTVAAGWPARSSWIDFDTMFELNRPIMLESCENNWSVADDSNDEIANLKAAILSVGMAQSLDPRFILAIVMQESNGCVRVITTNYGVENPGLMQSHNGDGSCNRGGVVQNPCPASEITQMIEDGSAGTSSGDGLVQCIAETGIAVGDVSRYYGGARIYNGGMGGYNKNDLGSGCCTLCYSSDVANRLVGWSTGVSGCTL